MTTLTELAGESSTGTSRRACPSFIIVTTLAAFGKLICSKALKRIIARTALPRGGRRKVRKFGVIMSHAETNIFREGIQSFCRAATSITPEQIQKSWHAATGAGHVFTLKGWLAGTQTERGCIQKG